MSFSGIKSYMKRLIDINKVEISINTNIKNNIAASFEEMITEYFMYKLQTAIQKYDNDYTKYFTSIVIAGGVASNRVLRNKLDILSSKLKISIKYPPVNLCTDNGVMVAWNGYEKFKSGFILPPINKSDISKKIEVRTRWKF
jgi:N6-L-threonylcarbamoyladenine synthase